MTNRQDDSGALRERLSRLHAKMIRQLEADAVHGDLGRAIDAADDISAVAKAIAALSPQGSEPDGAQGGEDGPDVFDCSHAAAVRACGCGFCICLSRPAIAPQTTPTAVDDAMVERALLAFMAGSMAGGWTYTARMKNALTAALAARATEVKP